MWAAGAAFIAACAGAAVPCADVHHDWDVRFDFLSPDGARVDKMMPTVNGGYPGPEVRVAKGESVSIAVTNDMSNTGVSIHWHGITKNGWYDGVTSGTQCPIGQKEKATYKFMAHQHGTFFWHAHSSTLRAPSLTGALIIEDPDEPFSYDDEFTVLLADHWNSKDDRELIEGLRRQSFRWVGDPQSILMNGKGCAAGDWAVCAEAGLEPATMEVTKGKTYRLRLINAAAMSFLSFGIEGHSFTVVEVDGHYVEPYEATTVEFNAGNRVSVLMTAEQTVGNYWTHASTKFRDLREARGVLRYAGASAGLPTTARVEAQSEPMAAAYSDTSYLAAAASLVARDNAIKAHPDEARADPCPLTDDRKFAVVNSQERMDRAGLRSFTPYTFAEGGDVAWAEQANVELEHADTYGFYGSVEVDGENSSSGYLKWPVHVSVDSFDLPAATGTAADVPATPIQLALFYGVDHGYPAVFGLELGDVVTLVFQNARALNGGHSLSISSMATSLRA